MSSYLLPLRVTSDEIQRSCFPSSFIIRRPNVGVLELSKRGGLPPLMVPTLGVTSDELRRSHFSSNSIVIIAKTSFLQYARGGVRAQVAADQKSNLFCRARSFTIRMAQKDFCSERSRLTPVDPNSCHFCPNALARRLSIQMHLFFCSERSRSTPVDPNAFGCSGCQNSARRK